MQTKVGFFKNKLASQTELILRKTELQREMQIARFKPAEIIELEEEKSPSEDRSSIRTSLLT